MIGYSKLEVPLCGFKTTEEKTGFLRIWGGENLSLPAIEYAMRWSFPLYRYFEVED